MFSALGKSKQYALVTSTLRNLLSFAINLPRVATLQRIVFIILWYIVVPIIIRYQQVQRNIHRYTKDVNFGLKFATTNGRPERYISTWPLGCCHWAFPPSHQTLGFMVERRWTTSKRHKQCVTLTYILYMFFLLMNELMVHNLRKWACISSKIPSSFHCTFTFCAAYVALSPQLTTRDKLCIGNQCRSISPERKQRGWNTQRGISSTAEDIG